MSTTQELTKTQVLAKKLQELREESSGIFFEVKRDADGAPQFSKSQYEQWRKRLDEANTLSEQLEEARSEEVKKAQDEAAEAKDMIRKLEEGLVQSPYGKGGSPDVFGDWLKGEAFKNGVPRDKDLSVDLGVEGMKSFLAAEQKTTMALTAGYAAPTVRDSGVSLALTRPVQMLDMIRTVAAGSVNSFMQESTFTNNAAETAEAGTMGEAALVYTEVADTFRKIAVFIPVTDEQLADVAEVNELVNSRLAFMVRQRLDGQVTAGNGTAPNLRGLYNATNVQTQARGSDTQLDAILKAMGKVAGSGSTIWAVPNFLTAQTADIISLALLKDSTGRYLLGNPEEALLSRVWGLQIVRNDAMTADTGLVGDSNFAQIRVKTDLSIKASDSHSDFFIKGIVAIRAEVRAALRIERGEAMCRITDFVA